MSRPAVPYLVVLAVVAVFATTLYAVRRRRLRGYVLLPPPGKHSAPSRGRVRISLAGDLRNVWRSLLRVSRGKRVARIERTPRGVRAGRIEPTGARPPARADQVARTEDPGPADPAGAVRLAAPVELWFGETRIGVVPGSEMHRRFNHYANKLLAELPAVSSAPAKASAERFGQPTP